MCCQSLNFIVYNLIIIYIFINFCYELTYIMVTSVWAIMFRPGLVYGPTPKSKAHITSLVLRRFDIIELEGKFS